MTTALALATGVSVDQTRAQLPGITVPGVIDVQPSSPSVTVTVPSLPPVQVTPPPVTVPPTPVTPEVQVQPPSVRVTPPPAPRVEAPALSPQAPKTPPLEAEVDGGSGPGAGAPTGPGETAGRGGTDGGSAGGGGARRDGAGSGDGASGRSGVVGGGGEASGAGAGSAGSSGTGSAARRAQSAVLSPADRRLLRRTSNRPLRGAQLRRLRRALDQYGDCLGALPPQGRRALGLRAGVGPGPPLGRRAIARRLGVSVGQVLRSERSALRRLVGAGASGRCGGGAGAGLAGGLATGPGAIGGDSGAGAQGGAGRASSGEAGDRATARDDGAAGGSTDPLRAARPEGLLDASDSGESAVATALVLLLVLLALGLGALALTRLLGGRAPAVAGAPAPVAPVAQRPRRRPLLFLSASGLISMERPAEANSEAPPGAPSYVSDRARELVRRLATHFDLVLIVGWKHDVNRVGRVTLDDRELPLLAARRGSTDSKVRGVARLARHRPAAWVERDLGDRHMEWADRRSLPTLLIDADDEALAEEPLVALLDDWAEQVAHGERPRRRLVSQP